MEREAALTLLRSQHDFPGAFEFRVVVRPPQVSSTLSAMVAGAGADAEVEKVDERRSRTGRYVALRVRLAVQEPEQVLEVYDVLRRMEGVLVSL